jgi:hypothetical protein
MSKRKTGGKRGSVIELSKKRKTAPIKKEDFTVPRLVDITQKTEDTSIVHTTTNIEESKKAVEFIRKAFQNKNMVLSGETERMGYVADFAHFDFMIDPNNLTNDDILRIKAAKNDLEVLTVFWGLLWPYIDKLLKSYEVMEQGFEHIQNENIDVEKNYAQQSLILRIYKQFMENNNDAKSKFNRFYKEEKKKYDKLAEEAVKNYHEQRKSEQESQESK